MNTKHIHTDSCCTKGHTCGSHSTSHQHGPTCGHQTVKHGDHMDYVVDGHLHHACMGHCDDHGAA
jgi:hypothetical protein